VEPATLHVNSAMNSLLEALARRTGKSKTDVLQRAVALYNFLIEKSATHDIVLFNRCEEAVDLQLDLGVNAFVSTRES
jgi:tRNA A37 threonylcarbamoyladenosine dehydratase